MPTLQNKISAKVGGGGLKSLKSCLIRIRTRTSPNALPIIESILSCDLLLYCAVCVQTALI